MPQKIHHVGPALAIVNVPLNSEKNYFFECMADRKEPISDARSHHRALTTCHLAGIAARLNREIRWDTKGEKIIDDPDAAKFIARENRSGYEIS